MNRIVTIVDVFFPAAGVSIQASDGEHYPVEPKLAKQIRSLPVSDLKDLFGAGAELAETIDGTLVIGLRKPQGVSGQIDEAPATSTNDFGAGATQVGPMKKKLIIDTYGVAVDVDGRGDVYVYPCNRFGAPDPVGTKVTDPAFLALARAAMGEPVLA